VLLLQGGGTGQFASIPLNLRALSSACVADYAITGTWSHKAAEEAGKYLTVNKVFTPVKPYTRIVDEAEWVTRADAAYLYYCANETVHGVEYQKVPEMVHTDVPLVADISSNILSQPFDVGKHGIVFAGTQKNLGAAGLTIAVVRGDLIGHADRMTPSIFDYREQRDATSIYNTPPVFSIYLTKLVLEWIRHIGGVDTLHQRNLTKSSLIYDLIDSSDGFYRCPVEATFRSRMNIPFRIGGAPGDVDLEKRFIVGAEARGMISLKGHRSVGGIRASLYNAITVEETQKLADYMKEFMDDETKEN